MSRSKLDEAHESEADAVDLWSMRQPKGEVQQNIMKIENGYESLEIKKYWRSPCLNLIQLGHTQNTVGVNNDSDAAFADS